MMMAQTRRFLAMASLLAVCAIPFNTAQAQISISTYGQGGIRVGSGFPDCDVSTAGALTYSSALNVVYFCNGGAWLTMGETGIDALTDVIADYTDHNLFVGSLSGTNTTTGTYNIGLGYRTLNSNVAGQYNVAIGYEAMFYADNTSTITPKRNIAIGYIANLGHWDASVNTGADNVAIGYQAMRDNRAGSYNIALGSDTLRGNTGTSYNIAIGRTAMQDSFTGQRNMGIGAFSFNGAVTTASDNICIANGACQSIAGGSRNIITWGNQWPDGPLTGDENILLGPGAGRGLTTGSGNVMIGLNAGRGDNGGTATTTGSYNTFIGVRISATADNYTNGTAIGRNAMLTGSNRFVLGDNGIGAIYAQVTSITAISDERRKKDIADMDLGLNFVKSLRPVAYRFNNGDETLRYGLIAQELMAALPPAMASAVESAQGDKNPYALIQRDTDKDRSYRVNYGELTAPLVKAIQEQQAMLDSDQARIDAMNAALDAR